MHARAPQAAATHSAAAITLLRPTDHPRREALIDVVVRQLLQNDREYRKYRPEDPARHPLHMADYVFAVEDEPHLPEDVFEEIRWGGQFVYISHDRNKLVDLPVHFAAFGFEPLRGPGSLRYGPLRFIPYMGRRLWYFVCRKLQLIRPRDISERFTYDVQLVRRPPEIAGDDDYVVLKEVPPVERVMDRLRKKFADAPLSVVEKRARKFTEKVFPLFLTREAAMLKILHRDLPPQYVDRVPTLLHMESDERGYARRIWMKWLRIGAPRQLTQIEFALQAADLLQQVHERARIIHLDLRLDNFLITENGVCFVDFGSAVRDGEDIGGNPLLSTLFEELMRTSQIQRMLLKMSSNGTVTSKPMHDAVGKVDKQVDLFYLAVQINQPLNNPDFQDLVDYHPGSEQAKALLDLTQDVLKPMVPAFPKYRSAEQLLKGLQQLAAELHLH